MLFLTDVDDSVLVLENCWVEGEVQRVVRCLFLAV